MTTTRNRAIEDARATIIRAIDFLDEERSRRETFNGWTERSGEDVETPKQIADALHSLLADIDVALPEEDGWRDIESAPKDGKWILAHGGAYPEMVERGSWVTASLEAPRVPFTMLIKWIEGWYDEDVPVGDGLFRKEQKCGYAYWWPQPHAFHPTHWMPLPTPPKEG